MMRRYTRSPILFVETGTHGGGSFESLYQYLRFTDRDALDPIVCYVNENKYTDLTRNLGIEVFHIKDPIYSNSSPLLVRRILGRLQQTGAKYLDRGVLHMRRFIHLQLIRELSRICKGRNVRLIYLNDQINRDLFGLFIADHQGIPCISHLRSMDGKGFGPSMAAFANRVVSAFISNSAATKNYWEKKGIDPEKNHLVYNAIPMERAKAIDIRKRWHLDNRFKYIIGMIGRLVPLKGHSFLLRAFAKLRKVCPDVILLVVGDGPLKIALRREATELGIGDNVIFLGHQTDAAGIIASLDILVLTSRYESFGRVLLEGMINRVPVVGTNLFGIPEIIVDKETGLLVTYDDDNALCQAMMLLIQDQELRNRIVEKAFLYVQERFNIDKYVKGVNEIIWSVIQPTYR